MQWYIQGLGTQYPPPQPLKSESHSRFGLSNRILDVLTNVQWHKFESVRFDPP